MASRFAAGLFGRNLTSTVARVQGKAGQSAVRRLATAAGENEFVAERVHHKEHAGSKYHLKQQELDKERKHRNGTHRIFEAAGVGTLDVTDMKKAGRVKLLVGCTSDQGKGCCQRALRDDTEQSACSGGRQHQQQPNISTSANLTEY